MNELPGRGGGRTGGKAARGGRNARGARPTAVSRGHGRGKATTTTPAAGDAPTARAAAPAAADDPDAPAVAVAAATAAPVGEPPAKKQKVRLTYARRENPALCMPPPPEHIPFHPGKSRSFQAALEAGGDTVTPRGADPNEKRNGWVRLLPKVRTLPPPLPRRGQQVIVYSRTDSQPLGFGRELCWARLPCMCASRARCRASTTRATPTRSTRTTSRRRRSSPT